MKALKNCDSHWNIPRLGGSRRCRHASPSRAHSLRLLQGRGLESIFKLLGAGSSNLYNAPVEHVVIASGKYLDNGAKVRVVHPVALKPGCV
eukprot:4540355-Pyramimonas_sp.AAC.1